MTHRVTVELTIDAPDLRSARALTLDTVRQIGTLDGVAIATLCQLTWLRPCRKADVTMDDELAARGGSIMFTGDPVGVNDRTARISRRMSVAEWRQTSSLLPHRVLAQDVESCTLVNGTPWCWVIYRRHA